jgi:hypothetical protein
MPSIVMLNVIMLNAITLHVIMPNVVAPVSWLPGPPVIANEASERKDGWLTYDTLTVSSLSDMNSCLLHKPPGY